MKLSPEQAALILEKLHKSPTQTPCSVCGSETWVLHETLYMMQEYDPSPNPAGFTMPLVVVMCQSCGNTKLLNAVRLNLFSGPIEEIQMASTDPA